MLDIKKIRKKLNSALVIRKEQVKVTSIMISAVGTFLHRKRVDASIVKEIKKQLNESCIVSFQKEREIKLAVWGMGISYDNKIAIYVNSSVEKPVSWHDVLDALKEKRDGYNSNISKIEKDISLLEIYFNLCKNLVKSFKEHILPIQQEIAGYEPSFTMFEYLEHYLNLILPYKDEN